MQNLTTKELIEIVTKRLNEMGANSIDVKEIDSGKVVATFNLALVTSFKNHLTGWSNTGIMLDETKSKEYKIIFTQIHT